MRWLWFIIFNLLTTQLFSQWYNTDWLYRKNIRIVSDSLSGTKHYDFPERITLTGNFLDSCQSDYKDIIFTNPSNALLSFDVENFTSFDSLDTLATYSDSNTNLQGVTTDGNRLYVSAQGSGYPGKLIKYTDLTTDAVSTQRQLTTDPDTVVQIADIFYYQGYIYVADATAVNDVANSEARVVRFDTTDLSWDSVPLHEHNAGYFAEGITNLDGNWYLSFALTDTDNDRTTVVRKYNSSWVFQKEYLIENSGGDSNGIDFFTQYNNTYLVSTTHENRNGAFILPDNSSYLWIALYDTRVDSFVTVAWDSATSKLEHSQGLYFSNRTNGQECYMADRVNSKIVKVDFSNALAFNDTINYWVKLDSLSSADTTLYMYFGNAALDTTLESETEAWNSNYTAVWHIDEEPISVVEAWVKDATQYRHWGDFANGVTQDDIVLGNIGSGIDLDGTGERIAVTSDANIKGYADWTFEAWVYPVALNTSSTVRNRIWDHTGGVYAFALNANGTSEQIATWTGNWMESGDLNYSLDTWYHVVITNTGSVTKYYLNGDSVDVDNHANGDVSSNSGTLYIGDNGSGSNSWNGILDELRQSKSIRSTNWILDEYKNQKYPFATIKLQDTEQQPSGGSPPTTKPKFILPTNWGQIEKIKPIGLIVSEMYAIN